MATQNNELDIIEQLNEASSVRAAILSSVDIFETTLDKLVQRVFRKDDHAVRYAVEPLLNTAGPLADLTVRLKLLYALGIINQNTYQDIEHLIKLRDRLNNDGQEYTFTSPETLQPIRTLHAVKKMGIPQLDAPLPEKEADINFYNMYIARQEQVTRSAFALAVASICTELNKETPLF